MENKIKAAMDDAYLKAIKALAGYKFWMFGYHAARWINFNKLLDRPAPNPFRAFVHLAREIINE